MKQKQCPVAICFCLMCAIFPIRGLFSQETPSSDADLAVLAASVQALDNGKYPKGNWSLTPKDEWRVNSAPGWLSRVLLPVLAFDDGIRRKWLFEKINPDLVDWMSGITGNRNDFFRDRGIRCIGAGNHDWEWDSIGRSHSLHKKMRYFTNPSVYLDLGLISVCQSVPLFTEARIHGNLHYARIGDGIGQDQFCVRQYCREKSCPFCNEKFQRYLASRFSVEELSVWGIKDIRTVNFAKARELPADRNLSGLYDAAHDYITDASIYEVARQAGLVRSEGARRGKQTICYGNLGNKFGMTPWILYYVPYVDSVWLEDVTCAPAGTECSASANEGDGFRQTWGHLSIKVGLAASHYKKPVCLYQTAGDIRTALANGGVYSEVMHPAHALASDRMKISEFIHHHRGLFVNRVPYADVGLVYSLKDAGRYIHLFRSYANVLQNAHIPYRVLIFGEGRRWLDNEMLGSLNEYKLLILPGVPSLTDEQLEALKAFVERGGRLLVAGKGAPGLETIPEKQLQFIPVKTLSAFTYGTTALQGRGKDAPLAGDPSFISLAEAVHRGIDRPLLQADCSNEVWIEAWRHNEGNRLSLHMMNYGQKPCDPFTMRIQLPDQLTGKEIEVLLLSFPDSSAKSLASEVVNGTVKFTVPELQNSLRERYAIISIAQKGQYSSFNAEALCEQLLDRLDVCGPALAQGLRDEFLLNKQASKQGAVSENSLLITFHEKLKKEYTDAVAANANDRIHFRERMLEKGRSAFRAYDFGVGLAKALPFSLANDQYWRHYGIPFNFKVMPAPDGWRKITPATSYASDTGCGFLDTSELIADGFPEPANNPVFIDRIEGKQDAVFRIDLPDGRYVATVLTYGMYSIPSRSGFLVSLADYEAYPDLYANGKLVLMGYPERHDRIEAQSFQVEVTGGQLDLRFAGGRGASNVRNNVWFVNGLIIEKQPESCSIPDPPEIQFALHDWQISEVYKDPDAVGMEGFFPPEAGAGRWFRYTDNNQGHARISLADIFGHQEDAVAYAKTFVKSEKEQNANLYFGSTGRGKVWVNGQLVLRDEAANGLKPKEYLQACWLNEGWNEILVKVVHNWGENWAFHAAFVPEDRILLVCDAGYSGNPLETIDYTVNKNRVGGTIPRVVADVGEGKRFREKIADGWTGPVSYDAEHVVNGRQSLKIEIQSGGRATVERMLIDETEEPIDVSGYTSLDFNIQVVGAGDDIGEASATIGFAWANQQGNWLMHDMPALAWNQWQKVHLPIPEKYCAGLFRVALYLSVKGSAAVFYVDDIQLK